MRLVILSNESFDGFAVQHIHVLGHRIGRLHVLFNRNQLLGILDPQRLDHLTMQHGQVVQLGG